MARPPKSILTHKAVALVTTGEAQGAHEDEYKWYVELKPEYKFAYGRNAGCGSLFFNTVEDFKDACPVVRFKSGVYFEEDFWNEVFKED